MSNPSVPKPTGWDKDAYYKKIRDGPLKKCGKCGIEKKKWSYSNAEWNKLEDEERMCQVCIKADPAAATAAAAATRAAAAASKTTIAEPTRDDIVSLLTQPRNVMEPNIVTNALAEAKKKLQEDELKATPDSPVVFK